MGGPTPGHETGCACGKCDEIRFGYGPISIEETPRLAFERGYALGILEEVLRIIHNAEWNHDDLTDRPVIDRDDLIDKLLQIRNRLLQIPPAATDPATERESNEGEWKGNQTTG